MRDVHAGSTCQAAGRARDRTVRGSGAPDIEGTGQLTCTRDGRDTHTLSPVTGAGTGQRLTPCRPPGNSPRAISGSVGGSEVRPATGGLTGTSDAAAEVGEGGSQGRRGAVGCGN